jgi:hypothetical protein
MQFRLFFATHILLTWGVVVKALTARQLASGLIRKEMAHQGCFCVSLMLLRKSEKTKPTDMNWPLWDASGSEYRSVWLSPGM